MHPYNQVFVFLPNNHLQLKPTLVYWRVMVPMFVCFCVYWGGAWDLGLSYRKGLNWGRTADPEEPLCLHPVEMKTTLSALRTQEDTEQM